MLYLLLAVCLLSLSHGWFHPRGSSGSRFLTPLTHQRLSAGAAGRDVGTTDSIPGGRGEGGRKLASGVLLTTLTLTLQALRPRSASAIGQLVELQSQSCVLQDVAFNVQDASREAEMFRVLFQDTSRVLRTRSRGSDNTTMIGFGPDAYRQPSAFRPGVSALFEYGGHSTITLRSRGVQPEQGASPEAAVTEIYSPGNALQFVKIGTEQLRISKGIAEGARVSGAYGWVDLESPSGVPLEVVVGTVADPLMYACLRVSSLAESTAFCEALGMRRAAVPYARQQGSNFEPQLPPTATYMTFSLPPVDSSSSSSNTTTSAAASSSSSAVNAPINGAFAPGSPGLGLLLVERDKKKKQPPLSVGSVLEGFTIVADTSKPLAPAVARALTESVVSDGPRQGQGLAVSPDGYRFFVQTFDAFDKETRGA